MVRINDQIEIPDDAIELSAIRAQGAGGGLIRQGRSNRTAIAAPSGISCQSPVRQTRK